MPLRFVLDEHLRGPLWTAIQHHNVKGVDPLDVVCVGDPPDLPLGSSDPDILNWAALNNRILVSMDYKTMPGYLAAHLGAGAHSPGVILLRQRVSFALLLHSLANTAHTGDPADYLDQVRFIP